MRRHVTATREYPVKVPGNGGGLARWLALAAAPTFTAMAMLTALYGGSELCAAGSQGWSLGGMMAMYLLMGVFHLPPWLRLASGQRGGAAGRRDARAFSARQATGA